MQQVKIGIQISKKKTTFYGETSFFKKKKGLATRFAQSTFIHYQAISHTDHSNLEFRDLLWI